MTLLREAYTLRAGAFVLACVAFEHETVAVLFFCIILWTRLCRSVRVFNTCGQFPWEFYAPNTLLRSAVVLVLPCEKNQLVRSYLVDVSCVIHLFMWRSNVCAFVWACLTRRFM